MHAMIENRETCAAAECCQPVHREVKHTVAKEGGTVLIVRIGYCFRHAAKILAQRARQAD